MTLGISYRDQLQPWQIELLEGKREPETDEEINWFEDHGTDILFDTEDPAPAHTREREFCPPTFVAKVSEILDQKADEGRQ